MKMKKDTPAEVARPPRPLDMPSSEASPLRRHLYWLAPALTAITFSAPHLGHPFWHDEIYTEIMFANDPKAALTDYHVPNNHILFSLMWWAFRQIVDNPAYWRFLPLGFFVAAVILVARAGGLWTRNEWGGWFAGMTLATSHPAIGYGTELRGYSPSMTFVALAILALAHWRHDPRSRWLRLYALAAFLAVGTVPVNLAAFAPMALWVWWSTRPGAAASAPPLSRQQHWISAVWCAVTPFSGLVFLIPVLWQLASSIEHGSSMTRLALLAHFPYSTLLPFLWLPLSIGLAGYYFRRRWTAATASGDDDPPAAPDARPDARPEDSMRERWIFLGIMALTPLACCLAMPRPPNDYTLVSTVPGICFAIAWVAEGLCRRAAGWLAPRRRATLAGGVLAVMFVAGALREAKIEPFLNMGAPPFWNWLKDVDGKDVSGLNLHYQRYHNHQRPIELVDFLAKWLKGSEDEKIMIVLHDGDILSVKKYWEWRHGDKFPYSWASVVEDDFFGLPPDLGPTFWKEFQRHFFVMTDEYRPSHRWVRMFIPPGGNPGWLALRFNNSEYTLLEWLDSDEKARREKQKGIRVIEMDPQSQSANRDL